jgi:hypothetical protein
VFDDDEIDDDDDDQPHLLIPQSINLCVYILFSISFMILVDTNYTNSSSLIKASEWSCVKYFLLTLTANCYERIVFILFTV